MVFQCIRERQLPATPLTVLAKRHGRLQTVILYALVESVAFLAPAFHHGFEDSIELTNPLLAFRLHIIIYGGFISVMDNLVIECAEEEEKSGEVQEAEDEAEYAEDSKECVEDALVFRNSLAAPSEKRRDAFTSNIECLLSGDKLSLELVEPFALAMGRCRHGGVIECAEEEESGEVQEA
ncbi:hypothetical protein D9613_007364 [Agrocybe pediades]|uniref:Uncharacterized protein n=1 Tax=Agrocybe pediades TaxID=84607 RepID=A0A8H4QN33_9AGAR|nr:hypothetical protein D9613_007364 [Agrocybe pediades]